MIEFLREIRAPKIHVLYHAHCLDGLFAAWCVCEYLDATGKPDYLVTEVRYGEPPPLEEDTHLLIVDFSYSPEALVELPKGCHVTILDHHETALKQWARAGEASKRLLIERGPITAYFDMGHSGAGLAYGVFMENVSQLNDVRRGILGKCVPHVEDRDLWRFALADTRVVCRALKEITAGRGPALLRENTKQFSLAAICQLGNGLLLADAQEIKHLLKSRSTTLEAHNPLHHLPVTLLNYMGPLLSDLLHEACVTSESRMAAAYVIENGKVAWSLRSLDTGPNVAEIAAKWGGGGHAHAAGFRCALQEFSASFVSLIR